MRLLRGNDRHVHATPAPAPTDAPSVVTGRSKETAIKSEGLYLWVAGKVTPAMGFSFGGVALSAWISGAWVGELEQVTGLVLAWTIVVLVVYLPGAVVAFLAASRILDRQTPLHVALPTTALTAIIAAPHQERGIGEATAAISGTSCAGPVTWRTTGRALSDTRCCVRRHLLRIRPTPPGGEPALEVIGFYRHLLVVGFAHGRTK